MSLAKMIGGAGPGVVLLQAIVTAVPSAGTCTIRFGDLASTTTTDDIAGVRMLASASVSNGDSVWVLQTGGALLVLGKLSGGVDTVPVGSISAYWGTTAPSGWLLCNGGSFSAVTYPALAALLGGTATPNLKGRVVVGIDPAQTEFDALGETGGAKTHTLSVAELASHGHSHGHTVNAHAHGGGTGIHAHNVFGAGGSVGTANTAHGHAGAADQLAGTPTVGGFFDGSGHTTNSAGVGNTSEAPGTDTNATAAGSTNAHNNLQPYTALSYIIKAA